MSKVRKNVTQKLVSRISALTNNLFKQSIVEVMNVPHATDEEITDFMSKVRMLKYHSIMAHDKETLEEFNELFKDKEEIDEVYLSKMMMLDTQDLNDILFLHEHGKPRRAMRTLEAIHSELARRELLDDSSQSDAIYSNGEVDVKRKSKPIGKTAPKKRNKANKNR